MQLIATKLIGALGRIVIPSEVRKTWGLEPGTKVGVYLDNGRIVIQALNDKQRCVLCGAMADGKLVKGKHICDACIDLIKKGA